VGKKHIRLAVSRNRIKRVVRESFRLHACELGALDVVVLCRCDARTPAAELRASLEQHWRRVRAAGANVRPERC